MELQCKISYKFISILLVVVILFVGCQPTPKNEAVQNKNEVAEQSLVKGEEATEHVLTEERFTYEKQYKNGTVLIADAWIRNNLEGGAPVLIIEPKPFGDRKQMENLVDLVYPKATIYTCMDKLTKEELEAEILRCKDTIYRIKAGLPTAFGDIVSEAQKAYNIQMYEEMIAEYQLQYQTAPHEEYREADYTLKNRGADGYQCLLFTYGGIEKQLDNREEIWFVNDEVESLFRIQKKNYRIPETDKYRYYSYTPEELLTNETFLAIKSETDSFVKEMGLDYMKLNSVQYDEDLYTLNYVRAYNGLEETMVGWTIGEGSIQTDTSESIAMKLWGQEILTIDVQDGEICKIYWVNPSQVSSIESKSVELLSFEEIEEVFIKQMDYLLQASIYSEIYGEDWIINIERVELGLVKVLEKGTDSYKLVPAWTFMGREDDPSRLTDNGYCDVCYMTINAIDGTVIDRTLMY